jgi:hypothetical protein
MFKFGMVKLVILILTGPFIEIDCLSVRVSILGNIRKVDDPSTS